MFDIGFWELALIGVIALLVIGPERLPAVARNVGLWVGRARRYVAHVKRDIERELHADEMRQLLDKPEALDELRSIARETASVFEDTRRELDATANNLRDSASAPAHALGSGAGDAQSAPATHSPATHSPATHSPATHSVADKAPATHSVAGQAADDDLFASASSARVSPAGGDAAPGDSPVQPSSGDLTQHDEKSARQGQR